jgi:hypothetical protein
MKCNIVLAMLAVWVMALITPTVLAFTDEGNTPYALNLNEEEQKENHEYDADQKQLTFHLSFEIAYLPGQNRITYRDCALLRAVPHYDIFLPPPEFTV